MEGTTTNLVNLPPASVVVTDADEEVFLLYTMLASYTSTESGLGFVDPRQDALSVVFDIIPRTVSVEQSLPRPHGRRNAGKTAARLVKEVEITLAQDQSGLRSRKGDTGSVLWRASVHFARSVLTDHYFPPPRPELPFFSMSEFMDCHILELGAGTGVLSVLLSPIVRRYTATDLEALVPLIRKNIHLNNINSPLVTVEELDWDALSTLRPSAQAAYFQPAEPVDILLCVDCIYNQALVRPLIDTINYLAVKDRTKVVIVVELRDEEVVREFLQEWLRDRKWEIWRYGEDLLPGSHCVVWIGWKI